MSRESVDDLQALLGFLERYTFADLLQADNFVAWLKLMHKHHLALLTTIAELTSTESDLNSSFVDSYGEQGRQYLIEVGSDCSEHLLTVASGCYRAGATTLRASIESFAKAFSALEAPEVLEQTSVYKVFDIAKECAFFKSTTAEAALEALRGVYVELNHFAHTVGPSNIFGAHSAGAFPIMSQVNDDMAKLFARAVRGFISALIGTRRDLYDRFDHRNKLIVASSLTRAQRRTVFGTTSTR